MRSRSTAFTDGREIPEWRCKVMQCGSTSNWESRVLHHHEVDLASIKHAVLATIGVAARVAFFLVLVTLRRD